MKLIDLYEASIFDENILKSTKWESPTQLRSWLVKNGFKRIGTGAFSSAYVKPGHKRIVKISKKSDPCWISFVEWSLKQTRNKHLPNIPWVKQYKTKNSSFFVTIIEKLEPLTLEVIDTIDDPVVLAALIQYGDLFESEKDEIVKRLASKFKIKSIKKIKELVGDNQSHKFIWTLKRLQQIIADDCFSDLHFGNFMWRPSDKSVVIIDPFATD